MHFIFLLTKSQPIKLVRFTKPIKLCLRFHPHGEKLILPSLSLFWSASNKRHAGISSQQVHSFLFGCFSLARLHSEKLGYGAFTFWQKAGARTFSHLGGSLTGRQPGDLTLRHVVSVIHSLSNLQAVSGFHFGGRRSIGGGVALSKQQIFFG